MTHSYLAISEGIPFQHNYLSKHILSQKYNLDMGMHIRERKKLTSYVLTNEDRNQTGIANNWGGNYKNSNTDFETTKHNRVFDSGNSILALDVETIEVDQKPYPARGTILDFGVTGRD